MKKVAERGKNRNASPSSSEANENISQFSEERTGRARGSWYFVEDEYVLVALMFRLDYA